MFAYRIEQARDLGRAALGFAPAMNDQLGSTNSPAPAGVRELELTWRFFVSPELRYVPRVELGCGAGGDLPVFATMVRESEAFAVAQRETALSVSVGFMAGAG